MNAQKEKIGRGGQPYESAESDFTVNTEFKVYRHRPDPIRAADALSAGMAMVDCDDRKTTLEDVIWALLKEAAETERCVRKPGPSGYTSAYPEIYYTPSELFALYVENAREKIIHDERPRPRASAAAMSRYIEVTAWLRYCRGKDVAQSKRILWRLAQGMSAARLAHMEGYGTARGVLAKQKRELTNIAERLVKELPEIKTLIA